MFRLCKVHCWAYWHWDNHAKNSFHTKLLSQFWVLIIIWVLPPESVLPIVIPPFICGIKKRFDSIGSCRKRCEYKRYSLIISEELFWWKLSWKKIRKDKRLSTTAQSLKACNKGMSPNLHTLFRLCTTIHATSCECERFGGVLKLLHIYLRASMAKTRLSGLAFMHIKYGKDINVDKAINIFARKKRAKCM